MWSAEFEESALRLVNGKGFTFSLNAPVVSHGTSLGLIHNIFLLSFFIPISLSLGVYVCNSRGFLLSSFSECLRRIVIGPSRRGPRQSYTLICEAKIIRPEKGT